MSGRLILCPPPERATTDGTRPGPCHIWSRCPDLNRCEPRGRCCFKLGERYPAPAEPAAPEHDDGGDVNYSRCRRCGSLLLPGRDMCGQCLMPSTFRGYEGRCQFCGRDIGAGHAPDCPYASSGKRQR